MNVIINEITKSLEHKCFRSALALTLTLPDILGEVYFPNINTNGGRYKAWFKQFIKEYWGEDFNENVCWQLRCSILHSGNFVFRKKIVDQFEICITSSEDCGIYMDSYGEMCGKTTMRIDLRRLCKAICRGASNCFSNLDETQKNLCLDHSILIIDIEQEARGLEELNSH